MVRVRGFANTTQTVDNWCWAAVTRDVQFHYERRSARVCDVVNSMFDEKKCCDPWQRFQPWCDRPADMASALGLADNLDAELSGPVTASALHREVSANRPVVVVFEWTATTSHALTVVGADTSGNIEVWDPVNFGLRTDVKTLHTQHAGSPGRWSKTLLTRASRRFGASIARMIRRRNAGFVLVPSLPAFRQSPSATTDVEVRILYASGAAHGSGLLDALSTGAVAALAANGTIVSMGGQERSLDVRRLRRDGAAVVAEALSGTGDAEPAPWLLVMPELHLEALFVPRPTGDIVVPLEHRPHFLDHDVYGVSEFEAVVAGRAHRLWLSTKDSPVPLCY